MSSQLERIHEKLLKTFPTLRIETPFSHAVISLFGGQVLQFVPKGERDLLWLSPLIRQAPVPIRGGVPVCWPYFARQGQADNVPFHGLARTALWQLDEHHIEADSTHIILLSAPTFDRTPLQLKMSLRIGRSLTQTLMTRNQGQEKYRLTQALHTYFSVGDVNQIRIRGLVGSRFTDKLGDQTIQHVQQDDWRLNDPPNPGRCDRIYAQTQGQYSLDDPVYARQISLKTTGSRSLVVWNPGEETAQKVDDIREHWTRYVCLEAANAGEDEIDLYPGDEFALSQEITSHALSKD